MIGKYVYAKSGLLKITQDIRQSLLCVTRLTTNAEITEKSSSLCIKKEIQTKKNRLHRHLGQITVASELIILGKTVKMQDLLCEMRYCLR